LKTRERRLKLTKKLPKKELNFLEYSYNIVFGNKVHKKQVVKKKVILDKRQSTKKILMKLIKKNLV